MGSGRLNLRSHFVYFLGTPASSQNISSLGPSFPEAQLSCLQSTISVFSLRPHSDGLVS